MSKENKNGKSAASPIEFENGEYESGLTKREYFAAMAMQGLMNQHPIESYAQSPNLPPNNELRKFLAIEAVSIADELLKQLEI